MPGLTSQPEFAHRDPRTIISRIPKWVSSNGVTTSTPGSVSNRSASGTLNAICGSGVWFPVPGKGGRYDEGDLRSVVKGRVWQRGDDGFDAARRAWNLTIEQPVAAVVEAEDAEDVAALVRTRGGRV